MSTLKDQLQRDLTSAMKSGDTVTRDALRSLFAAIKQTEKDDKIILDDDGVLAVIRKQVKQRQETIEDARRAGREDLIETESAYMLVLEKYLPVMMNEDEIRPVVVAEINESGASGQRDMGLVMKTVMPKVKGAADGKTINALVKDRLTS